MPVEKDGQGPKVRDQSELTVPAFMTILERAAERSKDGGEDGLHFTIMELDTLAFDPEFREFDPGLADAIHKKYMEILNGGNISQHSAATGR